MQRKGHQVQRVHGPLLVGYDLKQAGLEDGGLTRERDLNLVVFPIILSESQLQNLYLVLV